MTMASRWKMNRMGFVNFWLYDEEIFEFCDGKILLRGQNGAGKSIATQSFIPFILDGDRTPRRLDPFGSSDRRMEYYFLGDGEKEDSTGYLFLEFKKEETGQFRTLVIGQRAQKGKPMSFWGFVLMDGRRIGVDLDLYQQVGSEKIPYSKQDMKKLLGEEVPFTDEQRKYKEMVNRHLFGFPRMEQYEQFIQLLVKVRAPKLSKEFKPKKVYEILNESLQTLSDEDLRAMVDAMEKMDSIQASLEDLKSAQKDTQIIQNEYTRYNQYMLAKKGEAYLQALTEAEQEQKKVDSLDRQIAAMNLETREKSEELAASEERLHLNESELESLKDLELESAAEKKMKAEEECSQLKVQIRELDEKVENFRGRIRDAEWNLKDLAADRDGKQSRLTEKKEELTELNEVFLFSEHHRVMEQIECLQKENSDHIRMALKDTGKLIGEGLKNLEEQAAYEARYDEAQANVEKIHGEITYLKAELETAEADVSQSREHLIEECFLQARQNREFRLEQEALKEIEKRIYQYESDADGQAVQKLFEGCRDRIRSEYLTLSHEKKAKSVAVSEQISGKQAELKKLQQQADLEPARKTRIDEVRRRLTMAGIHYVPFFRAVEFAEGLSLSQQNLLEAQLSDAGVLDALIVSDTDWIRIQTEFSDVQDIFLRANGKCGKPFEFLTVNAELTGELKSAVEQILCHISTMESGVGHACLYLGDTGIFRNGLLCGVSCEEDAEGFIGVLTRKRKREQLENTLKQEISALQQQWELLQNQIKEYAEKILILEEEYHAVPSFTVLREELENCRRISWNLEQTENRLQFAEKEAQRWLLKKNDALQKVLAVCRHLPYNRTKAAFHAAKDALDDYRNVWERSLELIGQIELSASKESAEQENIDRAEEILDDIYGRQHEISLRIRALELQIMELAEFLERPESKEKAERLLQLKEEKVLLEKKAEHLRTALAVLADRLIRSENEKNDAAERLLTFIERENVMRGYFEEELALKLVLSRDGRGTAECAREAAAKLRESDKNREASDITATLMHVFQKNNSSLISYGAALDRWFDEEETLAGALRQRQVFTAVWNGKKIWLDEFYSILKQRIDETENLIQQKDRELFEDILSRTLSQQLTGKIAESRRWVADMSQLMRAMDTSMGLSFALDWRPRAAENDQQMDTSELEKLLLRDKTLMTSEDIERVASHFRSKIREEKLRAEESGDPVNYMDLVRDALDYRKWFEFQMSYYRGTDGKKVLTDGAFNRFSGGEKAMAMYVPLLAAVNAQYQKAAKEDHPRIVAMDEAFAGVDDKNISIMFRLVGQLDLDYIMNSQSLWGCFETVPALRISEMHRPANSGIVTVIHYTWNGKERILND